VGVLFWDELTRQQATALTREWEAVREARLAWLSTRLGRPLTVTADDLDVAWTWFLTWRSHPAGAASEPTPVWWREWRGLNARGEDMAVSQYFERDESIGLDALGHLCEEILRRDCPLLERWIHPAGPPKSPWMLANAPCLAVRRPRPSHGLTHTAITNVMGAMRAWGDEWRTRGARHDRAARGCNTRSAFGRTTRRSRRVRHRHSPSRSPANRRSTGYTTPMTRTTPISSDSTT
jgi:hypothetical protein